MAQLRFSEFILEEDRRYKKNHEVFHLYPEGLYVLFVSIVASITRFLCSSQCLAVGFGADRAAVCEKCDTEAAMTSCSIF